MSSLETNKQAAVGAACRNAVRAMANEVEAADRERRSYEYGLLLAAALEQIALARGDALAEGFDVGFQDCIAHLRRTAAPRRGS
jgi:hypothetical protein